MHIKKIVDYIQILFWICVLVAGATGAYTHFSWGYIDWVVAGQTVFVFVNTFAWITFIREGKIFKAKKTDLFLVIFFSAIPIGLIFMNLNDNLTGWNTGIDLDNGYYIMTILVIVSIFIGSMVEMRYGIIGTISFTTIFYFLDQYSSFEFNQYAYNFLALCGVIIISMTIKFLAKKVIFRRWSDVLVKQEKPVEQE